jgi:hypothetical protein
LRYAFTLKRGTFLLKCTQQYPSETIGFGVKFGVRLTQVSLFFTVSEVCYNTPRDVVCSIEKDTSMATIEERLTALERENTALKKSDELQTIALRALATKDEVTKLRDTNNAIFDALISHDRLTNERLGDIQTQMIELDGKIMGLQVETRHSFKDAQNQMVELDGKTVGMQTEMRQRFEVQDKKLDQILARLPEKP